MGNAEKEDIHSIIEKGIAQGLKKAVEPMQKDLNHMKYYFGTACLIITCFVGVMCIPVIDKVFKHESQLAAKANEDFVKDNFLTKPQYVFLEEEQNKATIYIFKDHEQAEQKYRELNNSTSRQLDVTWRSARQIN